MDHVHRYYQEIRGEVAGSGHFHRVIALAERPELSWSEVSGLAPTLPRGWYELAHLDPVDRIDFLREFWQLTLPFEPRVNQRVELFFSELASIDLFLTQRTFESPVEPHLVYALNGDRSFYYGCPPAPEQKIAQIAKWEGGLELPPDYCAFFRVHDGFGKYTDTGLVPIDHLRGVYDRFQSFLAIRPPLHLKTGEVINPHHLIPFYQSFGLDCYQCFYTDWYPDHLMGNLYYTGIDHSISAFANRASWTEEQAFPTFLDWLAFYLELVEG